MAVGVCGVELGVCAIRITRVNEDGSVIAGNNAYVSDKQISVGLNVNKTTGQDFSLRNGCGCNLIQIRKPDVFNWFELALVKAGLEPTFEAFLLGATEILDGAVSVGVSYPATLECNETPPAVAFEFWTQQYSGGQLDITFPWVHYVFPYTQWSLGNNTHQEEPTQQNLEGFTSTNSLWGQGPYNDGPPDGSNVTNGSWWETDVEPPSAECNALPVTATS